VADGIGWPAMSPQDAPTVDGSAPMDRSRRARMMAERDIRRLTFVGSLAVWAVFVVSVVADAGGIRALAAVVCSLTWGAAVATFTPSDDPLEFSVITLGSGVSLLLFGGFVVVELQATSVFFPLFFVLGAASLVLQYVSLRLRRVLPPRGRSTGPVEADHDPTPPDGGSESMADDPGGTTADDGALPLPGVPLAPPAGDTGPAGA
jgi:hypothetical protein